ncbi:MAG: DUF2325 domain-containing protein [Nitrospira sp.]|nr:DUF2325 domain-containing protein [bacterium]MBL7048323.1 DUF2325 domain-containing protein [Nitrospira sp.]
MCVALIGGMKRLERHYIKEAEMLGIKLQVFNSHKQGIPAKLGSMDALIIFTNKVSHNAKHEASAMAKASGIPVIMHHSCGLCTLRNCLRCLKELEPTKAFSGSTL